MSTSSIISLLLQGLPFIPPRSISSSDTAYCEEDSGPEYGAIAVMLTFPVHILTQFLWWGAHSLKDVAFVVQFLFVILTLLYLSRRPVKALFDETRTFRFISWHGLLAVLIILISFSWIIFSLYWKVHAAWKFGHPFFMDRPQVMTLEKTERPEVLEKYRKVELLNVSLLLPKEFSIGRLNRIERKNQKWAVSLQNQGVNTKGFMLLRNEFPYDELLDETIGKMLGSDSKFDLEKYHIDKQLESRPRCHTVSDQPEGGTL